MILGLSYLTQIRGGDNTGQLVGGLDDGAQSPDSPLSVGGWVALQFNQLVASLAAGYHKQHNANDTHGAITCDSISERNRLVPMGEWTSVPFGIDSVVGSGAMTVSVPASSRTYAYTLVGKTMTVAWVLDSVSIAGTPDLYVKIKIPAGYRSAKAMYATSYAVDNGVGKLVPTLVQAPSASAEPYIFVGLVGFATNWTASAANSALYGSFSFEVM